MKKIIASAVGLMLAGGVAATTASAVESQFGGYWRTRAFILDNFTQNGPNNSDSSTGIVDTRTRLYYTAKFSDSLKFVNKFEIDNEWGDNFGGDLGADGHGIFEIKNTYVDFTLGMVNTKVGIQGYKIARGFVLDTDASGVIATADFGMVKLPVAYAMLSNEDAGGTGIVTGVATAPARVTVVVNDVGTNISTTPGDGDVHLLSVLPIIGINDNISLNPNVTWASVTSQDTDIYWLGIDADFKFDVASAWATAMYNGGSVDRGPGVADADISAFLVAAGADAGIVHGEAFYASGDGAGDRTLTDIDGFVQIGAGNGANGSSYYWAEILGDGLIDYAVPNNTLGDKISNVWAVNVGVSLKPMDKMGIDLDLWYAQKAEDVRRPTAANPLNTEDELGVEFDARLSYEIMDNLNADLIFAYLFAGEVVGSEDVLETGLQLSLKF